MDNLRENDTVTGGKCPTRDQLELFSKGELLDEIQLLEIGRHLDLCAKCLTTVSESEILVDSQLGNLDAEPSTVNTAELRELWERFQMRAIPKTIGKYPNLGVASRGGMSIIYHSTHPSLGRPVVIKSLPGAQLLSQSARLRLIAEQKRIGEINHPTIVAALDADCDNGVPYIVMESLDGTDLSQWLRTKGAFQRDDACAIAALIADALQVLHQRNLVHRDVKPGNIFVTAGGQIKLLDLGLAFNMLLESEEASLVSGTPYFMAPEQSDPTKAVDHRSDIYGLGATLLMLLTGGVPTPLNPLAIKARLKESRLPVDLQQLILQMLADIPELRPSSATEVCERLAPYALRSKTIDLRPLANRSSKVSPAFPAWIFGVLLGVAMITLAAFGISSLFEPREVDYAPALPNGIEFRSGLGSQRRFVTNYPRSYPKVAKWNSSGDRIACFGADGDLRIYGHSGHRLADVSVYPCFQSTDVELPILQWLDDDRRILVGSSVAEPLKIVDSENGAILHFRQFDSEVTSATYSSTVGTILLGQSNGALQLVDLDLKTIRQSIVTENERVVSVAAFDDRFACVTELGTVFLVRGNQLDVESTYSADRFLTSVAWHPSGSYFVVGTNEGALLKFDGSGIPLDDELPAGRGLIRSIAWNSAGTQLAIGSSDASVVTLATGARTLLNASSFSNSTVDWHAHQLLIASYENGLTQWDSVSGESTTLMESTRQNVLSLAWSPQSDHLAVATLRGDLFVLDSAGLQRAYVAAPKHELPLVSVAWSPSGERLAAVYEWSEDILVSTLTESRVISVATVSALRKLCWVNETILLAAGSNGIVAALDVESGQILHTCEVGAPVSTFQLRERDGKLAVVLEDGQLAIGSVNADGKMEKPQSCSLPFLALACGWLAESGELVVTTQDGRVLLMDPHVEEVIAAYQVGSSHIRAVESNPTGEFFTVGELGCFSRHAFAPNLSFVSSNYAYSWSPDGRLLAAGNWIDELTTFSLDSKDVAWQVLLQRDGKTQRLRVTP